MDGVTDVVSFDGQTVWLSKDTPLFEVGNFLGGGAAGTVYEAENVKSKEHFALKILTPLGYKLLSPALLKRCLVLSKGKPVPFLMEQNEEPLSKEHIWWLMNSSVKQHLVAYFSEKSNILKELSLKQCMAVWGTHSMGLSPNEEGKLETIITPEGSKFQVPVIPPKYAEFIKRRSRIFREIHNMRKISNHRNVIRLENVLELTQESKCTIFLVMELANGGELFDRIKIDCGTREDTAVQFFRQVLDGVQHCHQGGVCHRDLKPENLLLQDVPGSATIVKIADFGFSAWVAMAIQDDNWDGSAPQRQQEVQQQVYAAGTPPVESSYLTASVMNQASLLAGSPIRTLNSVVGSPFYVAPEVLQAQASGYDGYKADVWSLGVILYAMLAGNLPFSQDLATCKRFRAFCKWMREMSAKGVNFYDDGALDYPEWLFSSKFSPSAKSLIVSMLHPDPSERISVGMAMNHQWLRYDVKSIQQTTLSTNNGDLTTSQDLTSTGRSVAQMSSSLNTTSSLNADAIDTEMDVDMDGTEAEMECEGDINDNEDDEDSIFKMDDDATSSSSGTAMSRPPLKQPSPMPSDRSRIGGIAAANGSYSSSDYGLPRRSVMHSSPIAISSSAMPIPIPQSPSAPQSQSMMMPGSWSAQQITPQSNEFISRSMPSTWISMPPALPHLSLEQIMSSGTAPPDLFTGVVEEDTLSPTAASRADGSQAFGFTRIVNVAKPPSFHDNVKRSTRFITAVAAAEVFQKLECVLIECKEGRLSSPVGGISRIELSYEHYSLEIWGVDPSGPPICTIRIFRLPSEGASSGPNMYGMSPGGAFPTASASPTMYLVEFVRGQVEIFAFKRFYNWVRQQVGELVKRDYGTSSLDQFGSPMRPSAMPHSFFRDS